MSVVLISSICRNEARFLDRFHAQLRATVAAMPQHQFLLSVVENDSADGSAAKLNALDWTFTAAHRVITGRLRTPAFVGGKHPVRTELLAAARNESIFGCPLFLPNADSVLVVEPDTVYTPAVVERLIEHERFYGRALDVFSGKSSPLHKQGLYDSWGSRATAEQDDWRDGDDEFAGFVPMWATFNCLCYYRAEGFRRGARFSGVNPRTGRPDCDTSAVVESFRLHGFNNVAWDTSLRVEHDAT